MATSLRSEQSVLKHDEYEAVRLSHHPVIYELDGKALQGLRVRLRDLRDKERTFSRQKHREKRGKAEARGGSFQVRPISPSGASRSSPPPSSA
jgi:hypothetical protein